MRPHDETIIELFVEPSRKDRLRSLAANPKRRFDFLMDLLHDPRRLAKSAMRAIPATGWREVEQEMVRLGAGSSAYCISSDVHLDGKELELQDALRQLVGSTKDALAFAIGSRVAYYENHEGERYLLFSSNAKR